MAKNDEYGNLWRSEILLGLSEIPHTGAVPGTIVVWGEAARSILNSAGHSKPVLVAVAELGRGRVAILAHEGLLKSAGDLTKNIEKWLTRSQQCDKHVLNPRSKSADIKTGDLLVWSGAQSTGDVTNETVMNHLLEGGCLLHAMCPWGWLQIHTGKCLSDIPLAGVLNMVGMFYTGDYGSIPHGGLDISSHTSGEVNHVLFTLKAIQKNPDLFLDDDCKSDLPNLDLSALPKNQCMESLAPEFQILSEILGCEDSDKQNARSSPSLIQLIAPCRDNPLKARNKRALVDIMDGMARLEIANLPTVDTFLGSFQAPTQKLCRTVEMKSQLSDIHPTGFYLVRGETLVLRLTGGVPTGGVPTGGVPTGGVPTGWSIRVGAHSDNLRNVQEPLRRWPRLVITAPITGQVTTVHSPYGGLVYLESPKDPSEIHACLENVVEAPLFNLLDPESVRSWPQRREAPGLWADVMGEHVIITLPAASVRHIDDPTAVMRTWDRVVMAHHDLRSTNPKLHRRQWVVTDEQPSAGYMHAGYPIVTHMDVAEPGHKNFLLNEENLLETGSWGMYHEMGHNMQRQSWTFSGTGEVTCNIFTLHAMQKVSGQPIWIHEWLGNQLKKAEKYISSSGLFSQWQADPGLALFIYAQIAHHFGWEVYKTVFSQYEQDKKKLDHVKDQEKINTWFVRMSQACGYNLAPLFEFWRIPITPESVKSLGQLRPCLPRDEITDYKLEYSKTFRDKYPGCCSLYSHS